MPKKLTPQVMATGACSAILDVLARKDPDDKGMELVAKMDEITGIVMAYNLLRIAAVS